ncbi:MAG: Mrp/NBP35 family ATP-binding protein [Chitinophagales bacterium]|nr:Mrp/NBP35 family ATP-binding protein [Chitinophagales bacterium]MDW8428261.1 Mrp/NBP35 family ATP-binding protein [Chitinophagales bacterium]
MEKLPLSINAVLKALSYVEDPDLKKDVVSLNMIRDLKIEGHQVFFRLVLTTPACPLKEVLVRACENAIRQFIIGSPEVHISVDAQVTTRHTDRLILPSVKNIIAVASGKGGVGKSTIAVNLALFLAREGAATGLLDADIHGPSVPVMLGIKGVRPEVVDIEGKPKIVPVEIAGVKVMSIGLLIEDAQAVVWRGPMVSSALKQFVSDCQWSELDYLIVDLPPGTGDIHLTLVQTVPLSGVIIVTTPQEVALADARKATAMFRMKPINVPVLGIVENMSYFVPPDMPDRRYPIFGEGGGQRLADEFGVPLLGQIPLSPALREKEDQGTTANPLDLPEVIQTAFCALAREVARQIAVQNATFERSEVSVGA